MKKHQENSTYGTTNIPHAALTIFAAAVKKKKFLKTAMTSFALLLAGTFFSGCAATVPLASQAEDINAKSFSPPNKGYAGVYIYRKDSAVGQALRKALHIDGAYIGRTAKGVYFFTQVLPGPHVVSTESEFGDNSVKFYAEAGKNYFFEQYIKMGVFVGGSALQVVPEIIAKADVLRCVRAQQIITPAMQ
ncbi:MAG: DUF2846 domain-containing protein [Puniceicoccales bacterium]|nr:DUF2846 domain-containing protein [Puniceicoccales bacterium]